jgi:chromosomal replication initiation ATPase DnaA
MARNIYRVAVSEEDRKRADLAVQIVALRFGVPVAAMMRDVRLSSDARRARRVAMYLTYVSFEWQQERVGHAFGVNRQTASTACRRIEDARENQELNLLLDELEGAIHAIVGEPGHAPGSGAPSVPEAA